MAVIFFLALILRLGYALSVNYQPYSDMVVYDSNAREILAGHGIPATGKAGDQYPLYPYFLAGIYAICGFSYRAVWIVQAFIGAITCVLVFLLAKRISDDPWVAILAGGLAAIYPDLILHCGSLLIETLYTFLLLLILLTWQMALQRRRASWYIAVGCIIGLAELTRSAIMFFLPLAILFQIILLWPKWKTALVYIMGIALGILLIWSPWLLRNQLNYGTLFTSNEMGFGFWGGNNPVADGSWTFDKHISSEQMAYIESISPADANKYALNQGLNWIRENPQKFIVLLGKKLHVLVSLKPDSIYKGNFFGPYYELFIPTIAKAFLWILTLIGLIGTINNWRIYGLLYSLLLGHVIMTLILFGYARYLVPLIPALSILAAQGVLLLLQYIDFFKHHHRFMNPYFVVTCVVLLLFFCNWFIDILQNVNLARDWFSLNGSACRDQSLDDCLPSLLTPGPLK
jgi:4-amino-4-deoxy-L-arabinose transferase-like glycosyltransferase